MELRDLVGRAPVALAVSAVWLGLAPPSAEARANARVIGMFTMRARVTVAVNVTGEHAGQLLTRHWVVVARGCHRNACASLQVDRQRSDNLYSPVTLRQVGPGRYTGQGAFYVAIACRGRVYPRGSRAPYVITLSVSRTTTIGRVRFAQMITASYVNLERSDATPCPLGPSHDAATYTGSVTAGLPSAPLARFSVHVNVRTRRAVFTDRSTPGRGNGRIVRLAWYFGDPGSPYGDTSTRAHPRHKYRSPGRYRVILRIVTADGLSATTTKTVRVRRPSRRANAAHVRSSRAPTRARRPVRRRPRRPAAQRRTGSWSDDRR
jgi:hypothetical protein